MLDFPIGIFSASVGGTYMLSMHVLARGTNNGPVRMKKNDDVICDLWIGQDGSWDIISCSTVIHLDLEDKVKVTGDTSNTATIIEGVRNGFSGILIHADEAN